MARVYQQVGALVRPGGVFLNGDNLPFAPNQPTFRRLAEHAKSSVLQTFAEPGAEDYQQWWQALEDDLRRFEPAGSTLLDGYHATEDERPHNFNKPILNLHEAALFSAGFVEVDTIWQEIAVRILLAVKGDTP